MKGRQVDRRIRHERDRYVRQARSEGYRSRAAYKLLELDRRHRLLRPAMRVLELGAAPGGWSQVVSRRIGAKGRLVCIDILPMQALPAATVIEGDFGDPDVRARLCDALEGEPVDLVLSDLAPNISGIAAADQARSVALLEALVEVAAQHLRPGGDLLAKAFQGEALDDFVARLSGAFAAVRRCKPKASRDRSRELYLLARSYEQSV